jgi:hypothetical protein
MQLKLDFSNVKTMEVLPVGVYHVVVSDAQVKPGQQDQYIAWEFTITEGPAQDRKLFENNSVGIKSLWSLKTTLLALGADPTKLSGEVAFDPADYIGAHALAIVGQKAYQGEQRNVVTKLQADPSAMGTGAVKKTTFR